MAEGHTEQQRVLLLARANQVDSGTDGRLPADVLYLCLEYGNIPLWETNQLIVVDVSAGFTEQRKASLREWCLAEMDLDIRSHPNRQVLFLTAGVETPRQIKARLRRDRKQHKQARARGKAEKSDVVVVIIQLYPAEHTWKWLKERVQAKAMSVVHIGCFYTLLEPVLSSYDVLCTQENSWLKGAGGEAASFVKRQHADGVFFVRTRGKKDGTNLQRCIFQDHLLGLFDL